MITDAQRWDKIHEKIHKQHEVHSAYAEEKEKLFPRGSIVCDLGGGTGGDMLYFLKHGHSVILFDISEFALQVAKKRAKEVKLDQNLVTAIVDFGLHALPLKNESIDSAYSRISLNYFGSRHTTRILKDIYRSLKPGATAYLTFKSPEDKKEMERLENNAVLYEPGVYIEAGQLRSRFTAEQLQEIGTKAGIHSFKVHHYEELLGIHETGHKMVLYQNEVIFTKPAS